MDLATTNTLIGWGTLVLQIGTLVLLGAYLFENRSLSLAAVLRTVVRFALPLALFLTFVSSALTLYYSDVLGLEPCPLCWWQRVFLYSQVVLFAIALRKKDAGVAAYSIVLSLIGGGVALYQHVLQVLPGTGLPCPASGTVSCAQRFLFEFGYITYPLAAATLFAFLIVLMLIVRRRTT